MAKSTSGKWVSRVGSAGGGKTYGKTRPSSFYAIVVLIVVLGLALVVFSRYEYQHPVKKVVVEPAIGTTEYAGLSIQDCGVTLPFLASDSTNKDGFIVGSDDVDSCLAPLCRRRGQQRDGEDLRVRVSPDSLRRLRSSQCPRQPAPQMPATTFKNGDVCGPKTKYSGKPGKVVYAYWTSFDQKKPTLTTNPAKIKFVKDLRLTMAFEPTGVTPTAPTSTTTDQMVLQATTSSTTTTTGTDDDHHGRSATTTTTTSGTTTTTKG